MIASVKVGPSALIMRKRWGKLLQSYREETGVTQRDLAVALDIDYYTMISQIERGLAKIPTQDLPTWARVLQKPLKDFAMEYLYWTEPYIFAALTGRNSIDEQGLPHNFQQHVKHKPKED